MVLGLLPPPPVFVDLRDRVNETSQLLTWTGQYHHWMEIIPFVLLSNYCWCFWYLFCKKSNLQFCNLNVFAFCKLIFPDERMIIESFNSNCKKVKTFFAARRESDAGDTFPDGVQAPAPGWRRRGLGLPGHPLQSRRLHPELPPQGPHTRYW